MLNLAEDLILLALDDETGKFHNIADISLDLALVGALLMDLVLMNRIEIQQDKLSLISKQGCKDMHLSAALDILASSDTGNQPAECIKAVFNRMPNLRAELLENLKNKGIVEMKDDTILWLFHHRRYPVIDDREEQEVRSRIRSIVLEGATASGGDTVLISLICLCDLIDKVFTKEELQTHKQRLELLKSRDVIAPSVRSIIAEIQMMIASSYIA